MKICTDFLLTDPKNKSASDLFKKMDKITKINNWGWNYTWEEYYSAECRKIIKEIKSLKKH